ncbi:PP2C family serine/threonine-protein phosphatase [Chitinilyticum piscinae]|uniref:Protein phosphatase 2C domain-containing protein n=1 Tax=Chitinilyticum piscinae TaxID=2866724 RepID=A0A8J7FNT9_9NEIS|nr:PP2C family serine/threonine-protein phosphatase [Chitinilyticum piscinae]MBE9610830.1 protein phosphatase 2C domain-containing protein [Chitinilyticum piscinae]
MPSWQGAAATLVGAAHLKHQPPVPCQDAALVMTGKRPAVIVADGAGSARRSHLGSQAVVEGLQRLFQTLGGDYAGLLDPVAAPEEALLRKMALVIVKHALGLLQDLARREDHTVADYRSTLVAAIGGRSRWMWIRVGDGALVVRRNGALELVGEAGKGEFANHTRFIDEALQPDDVQFGLIASHQLEGIAAMSDGTAERLVNLITGDVAGRLGEFMGAAQRNELTGLLLHRFFADVDVWQRTTGDDRALAVLGC